MPRFDNEGFNPEKRNRNFDADRTVPQEENYYGVNPVDLNFNSRQKSDDVVSDNQTQQGINPCNSFDDNMDSLEPPRHFRSERPQDYGLTDSDLDKFSTSSDRARKSDNKSHKPKKKHRHHLSLGKRILIFILVIILILVGSVGVVMARVNYNDKEDNTYVTESSLASNSMVKNILLLGVDARTGENAEETRSDTMMLVSLDMKHHCIKLVSFLRDTWVYIPTLGYEQRLNAACSSGGYQGVVDAIEYNFGIDIDGYAVVDFEMFKVLVDSLGGVEVDVTEAEAEEVTNNPYRYGDVVLDSGTYKLSGEQALAYCRIRKIDTDFVRTERQRTVMSAILNSAKHSNPFKLYNMAFKSAPYIETDMTKGELMSFVAQAGYCITGSMHQTKVPFDNTWSYATISGNSVISIDTEENKEMLIDYLYNKSSADITAEETSE
jgi:LCP family protein required for cell wall assembly